MCLVQSPSLNVIVWFSFVFLSLVFIVFSTPRPFDILRPQVPATCFSVASTSTCFESPCLPFPLCPLYLHIPPPLLFTTWYGALLSPSLSLTFTVSLFLLSLLQLCPSTSSACLSPCPSHLPVCFCLHLPISMDGALSLSLFWLTLTCPLFFIPHLLSSWPLYNTHNADSGGVLGRMGPFPGSVIFHPIPEE